MGVIPAGAAAGTLTEVSTANLPGVYAGGVLWGDLDNDGDLDLVLFGEIDENGTCRRVVQLYANTGGQLTLSSELSLGVYHGDVALGDYNNDGLLDLAVSGLGADDRNVLALYKNQTAVGGALNFVFDNRQPDINDPAHAVRYSSLAWGDYNKDGFLDLAVSGLNGANVPSTILFKNVNLEIRTELQRDRSQTLLNIHKGDLAWGDFDGDGDPDLVVNGFAPSGFRTAKLFRNEPTGTLREDKLNSAKLQTFSSSAIAWGDFDNDGDPDLLQSGWVNGWLTWLTLQETGLDARIGSINLLENLNLNVLIDPPVGDIAWGDIDNDGDLDIAIMGTTPFSNISGRILRNDGNGNFTLSQTFSGLRNGRMAWGDFDNDRDLDLIITGIDASGNRVTRLLRNDESFSSLPSPPAELFAPIVTNNSVIFSWQPGADTETRDQAALSYHLQFGTKLNPHQFLSGAFPVGDGNAGNALSIRLDVQLRPQTYVWSVRTVDKQFDRSIPPADLEEFTVQRFVSSAQQLVDFQKSGLAFGDLDGDGLPDLVSSGEDLNGDGKTITYLNEDGILQENANIKIPDLLDAVFAWGDVDNDGDLDLAMSGKESGGRRIARILRNDGAPNFLTVNNPFWQNMTPVDQGALDWGDYDNDGDLDLALMGVDRNGNLVTEILVNADGTLTPDLTQNLIAFGNGDLRWVDIDNDGDLDLSLTGETDTAEQTGRIYLNDGTGGLTEDVANRFAGLIASSLAWGDYDGDGDMDLVVMGQKLTASTPEIHLYRNDATETGARKLVEDTQFPNAVTGLRSGKVQWGDYDNDGDLDLITTGSDGSFASLYIYENRPSGFRFDSQGLLFDSEGFDFADLALVDLNNDGDLDIVVSGRTFSGAASTQAFDNMEGIDNPNPAPFPPAAVTATVAGADVTLQWDEAFDEDAAGIGTKHVTYRVRVGTLPGLGDILSGEAAPAFGKRGFARERRLLGLVSSDYYWSVQSVDNGYRTSDWSAPRRFRIDTVKPIVKNIVITPPVTGIGQISMVVVFEENFAMDNAVPPTVRVRSADGQTLDVAQISYDENRWIGSVGITNALSSGTAVVTIAGAADAAGNVMTAIENAGTFQIDTERPAVVETFPEAGASGIPSTADIRIVFSELVDPATITDENIRLFREDVEVGARQNGVTWDSTTNTVIFRPSELREDSRHTVVVVSRITDLVGNALDGDFTWSFRTADKVSASDGGLISNGDGTVEIYFSPESVPGDLQVPISPFAVVAGLAAGDHPDNNMNITFTGIAFRIGREDSVVTLNKSAILTIRFDLAVTDALGLDRTQLILLRLQDDGTAFDLDNVIGGTAVAIDNLPSDVLNKPVASFQDPGEIQTNIGKLGTFGLFEDLRDITLTDKLANVEFAPRVFAPRGHPTLPRQTGVNFSIGEATNVTIDIFNVGGRYVRSLAKGLPMNVGAQTVPWDGRDSDGNFCPMGLYIVRIKAAGVEKITTVGVVR